MGLGGWRVGLDFLLEREEEVGSTQEKRGYLDRRKGEAVVGDVGT